MDIDREPTPIDQKPELPKKKTAKPPVADSEEQVSRDLKIEEAARKKDQAEIEMVRASLGLEQSQEKVDINQYLQKHLGLETNDNKRIKLFKAKNLPEHYQAQREALDDKRLVNITIAVVPDDLWIEGKEDQPSESHAEKQLILMKQSYFEAQENPDEIAWLLHELAHCQNFLDSESEESYKKNMQTFAFEDLKTEYPYPNNPVEQFTFTKQFQYLKKQGKNRKDILAMLSQYYPEEDFPFFNRLLDNVYS